MGAEQRRAGGLRRRLISRLRGSGRKKVRPVTSRTATRSLGGIVGLLEKTLAEDTDIVREGRVKSRNA